jgi:UDP-N-acetylglucosamine 2-epimerase (non-hydrolysing)
VTAVRKLLVVVGTRPNFVKVTRFREVARKAGIHLELLHTGQHTDHDMTQVFFDQFDLVPDVSLAIEAGPGASRIAHMMLAMEPVMQASKPSAVMVVGDVDSTLAGALVAVRSGIPVLHLESGLRSFDLSMPEETNRKIVDRIARHHFITEHSALENLQHEGITKENIHFVGNTMIDTLVKFSGRIDADPILEDLQLAPRRFVLITMHRPAVVDVEDQLQKLVDLIMVLSEDHMVVFPVHPRTRRNLEKWNMLATLEAAANIKVLGPLDHFSFQKMLKESAVVITDSGGVQEESTFLKVPCLTLRPNTERPVTVEIGSNRITTFDRCAQDMQDLPAIRSNARIPELWDGHATDRVFEVLQRVL